MNANDVNPERRAHCEAVIANGDVDQQMRRAVSRFLPWGWAEDFCSDVAQNGLLSLFKWCMAGNDAECVSAVVTHMAKLRAIDFLRRHKRHVSLPPADMLESTPETLDSNELMGQLESALATLPLELQRIIELWIAGNSLQRIGERLGMPKENVRRRKDQGIELLRKVLNSWGAEL